MVGEIMKNILIVVDIQNGFIRYEQTKKLAEKIIKLTNSNFFDYIIATRFRNKVGSQYTRFLSWYRLMNSPDIDLVDDLHVDYVVDKWIYTCVDDVFIELLKKINEGTTPKHIFICGADTDCCVLKTATDLFEHNIMPIVLTRFCDSNGGPLSHNAGLLVMKRLIGSISLVDTEISCKKDLDLILAERDY